MIDKDDAPDLSILDDDLFDDLCDQKIGLKRALEFQAQRDSERKQRVDVLPS